MFVARELRKKSIAEYLLYMWQIEDIIRVYGCSLTRIRKEYIDRFDYTEEQKEDEEDWFGDLVRMMNQEGCRESGHLQINKILVQDLTELHAQLLASSKFPFYSAEYYRVLPYIVELRSKTKQAADQMARKNDERLKAVAAQLGKSEIETCFDTLYGVMMLRLQKKEISQETSHAVKEITTLIGMLSDYYIKDKTEGLKFEDD
ncbi:DUF4924 family protein [Prevotella dentasini]|uniref:DUF4924 family protein n=1 Tax=Prevotella dentasini TaxID=589537 RepID=UPI000469CB4D|nr:DUF4924 family protein [Prevotella dentasini]